MTITQDIKQELTRIQALQAPARLEIDAPAGRIESQIAACDAIGCSFETLTLRAPKLAPATIDQLKKLSDKLTSKLTYLLEPKPVGHPAQLESQALIRVGWSSRFQRDLTDQKSRLLAV